MGAHCERELGDLGNVKLEVGDGENTVGGPNETERLHGEMVNARDVESETGDGENTAGDGVPRKGMDTWI